MRAGSAGDLAVFSFNALKEMTSGEGGAIVTNDAGLARRVRDLAFHGIDTQAVGDPGGGYRHYEMLQLGFKASLTDIQAALLLPQLGKLAARRASREGVAARYDRLLAEVPQLELTQRIGTSSHSTFAVRVPFGRRDSVLTEMERRGIGCKVHYRATHIHPYYRDVLGFRREQAPRAADFGDRVLSLPLWPGLPPRDVDHVAETLAAVLAEPGGATK